MRIDVTQEHIDRGEPQKCRTCPVALAIKEQVGVCCEVLGDRVAIGNAPPLQWLMLPSNAVKWVSMFDMEIVKPWPFSFNLPLEPLLQRAKEQP